MDALTTLKLEIKQLIIDVLDLEDLSVSDFGDDTLLFGDQGLGLDSIDALELGVALRKKYQIQLEANSADNRKYFQSVTSLAELVQMQKSAA